MDDRPDSDPNDSAAPSPSQDDGAADHPSPTPRLIVGIGASAGGLEALQKLLSAMPADSGLALVIIQHLDPTHDSIMAELLAKRTPMAVMEVTEPVRLEPDHVYVIPPDRYLRLDGRMLHLETPTEPRGRRMAVDYFFRSLARVQGHKGVGVVLSGTGTDGTAGIRAIKAAGGMTLAQDPDTIRHHGMPDSAVATGDVDQVLAVEEMPQALLGYARHPYACRAPDEPLPQEASPPAGDLEQIVQVLRRQEELDFSHYKQPTLVRRINRRMGLCHVDSLEEYRVRLEEDEGEVRALVQDLLISVTDFFRDPDAFSALEDRVIGPLIERAGPERPLRVWVPACATGEEAYSIAMLLLSHLNGRERRPQIQVFASDVDERALNRARQGRYPAGMVADIPSRYVERYFAREGEFYQVRKTLREVVTFSRHDLLRDPPFSRLDLISCRNLLIYLRPQVQQQLLAMFHFALQARGFLFLGSSETPASQPDLFEAVVKQRRIYRRIGPARRLGQDFGSPPMRSRLTVPEPAAGAVRGGGPTDLLRQVLLATCTPPSVVVNARQEIQYLHGRLDDYLLLPQGEPALDLIRMLRPALRTRVRAALHRADRDGQPVEVAINFDDRPAIRVRVCPVVGVEQTEGYLVLTFEQLDQVETVPAGTGSEPTDALVRQLEDELQATREDLQSTVEELESANEELKSANEEVTSANEELQSTNEELETSTEELRSLNEELYTVNSQLREKIHELEEATNDINNLLSSTKIATLFLDPELRIKRYTAAATQLLRLIPTDVGRQITDITGNLPDPTLCDDAREVLDSLVPLERELETGQGQWFIRRVLPYRTEDDHIDGVVVTYTDITRLRIVTGELDRRARQQTAVADLGLRTLGERNLPLLLNEAVGLLARTLGVELTKVLELQSDGSLLLAAGQGWDPGLVGQARVPGGPQSQAGYTLQVQSPVIVDDLSQEVRFSGPALLTDHRVISGISVIIQGLDTPFGVLGVHTRHHHPFTRQDVAFVQSVANLLSGAIQREVADRALTQSEERYRTLVAATSALVWTTGPDGGFTTPQPQWQSFTGQGWEEHRGFGWLEVIHPEDRERVRAVWSRALRERGVYQVETRIFHAASRTFRHYGVRAVALLDDQGQVREWVGVIADIEERHQAEAEREALLERISQAQARAEAERARLHDLFMQVPALVGLHEGPDHVCVLANDQLRALCDNRPLLGLPLAEAMPEFVALGGREVFDRVYAGGEPHIGWEVEQTLDGQVHYFNQFFQPVFDQGGGVEGILAFALDVTEQVVARQALEDSRARYQQLAETMPQIVLSTDAQGRMEFVNSRCQAITGLSLQPGEDVRRCFHEQAHPDDQVRLQECFRLALEQGRDYQVEFRLRTREGGYRWFLGLGTPLLDEAGRVVRLLSTATDIEDQKQALATLAEADRQKDNFLAMLAHELRNPLAPIRNAASIMKILPLEREELVEIRDIVDRQVTHLARLVDDLLDLSRITRGRIELRPRRVQLREVVEGAVEAARPLIDLHRQQLTVELPGEPLWLDGDPVRLTQILGNLLNNASKYTDEDRGIWLSAGTDGDWIEIRIRDEGQGIAPENLEAIFDLFNRLDTSLDRASGGLGLGLTLARRLVSLHGGTLHGESPGPGQGSQFVVRLPRREGRVQDRGEPAPGPGAGPWQILVVDDNQDAAQALGSLLRARGHRVEVVHDGPQALETARQFKPRMVLLDIGLPGMDGYQVARRLRREYGEELLLVAVTGYGHQEARDQSRQAGFDHHLLKPVELAELDRLLQG